MIRPGMLDVLVGVLCSAFTFFGFMVVYAVLG